MGSIITATAPLFWRVGDVRVSWILNKVVVARVAMRNTTLTVYRAIWFAFVSQGVTITYLVLLAESIAVGNMDRADYVQEMPATLQSITFVFLFAVYKYIDYSTQNYNFVRSIWWMWKFVTLRK
jgi:hypothetical protein